MQPEGLLPYAKYVVICPIPSQMNFHHLPLYCRSILIFPPRLGFANGLFGFFHQNRVCIPPHSCHVLHPSYQSNNYITDTLHEFCIFRCISWGTHSFEKCFKEVRVLSSTNPLYYDFFFVANTAGFLLYMRHPRLYIRSHKYIYSISVTYKRCYSYSAGSKLEPKLVARKF